MRKVVGAHRRHLIVQFLGEALLLSFLALAVAVVLIELSLPLFNDLTGKTLATDYGHRIPLVLGLIGLGLVVGLVAGSYPAFYLSAFRPAAVLKGETRFGAGAVLLRQTLVVAQFVASITLIIGVGMVYRQLDYIQSKNLGFDTDQVVIVPLGDSEVRDNHQAIKQAFLRHPGVLQAAVTSGSLGGGDWGVSFRPEGSGDEAKISTRMMNIDYDFLPTMGMELAAGRNLSEAFATDADDAFLINETAARQLGWDDPVGRRIEIPDWRQGAIVGVVKDFHFRSLHETIDPIILFVEPINYNLFVLRIDAGRMQETLASLQDIWDGFVPERPFIFRFMDDDFAKLYQREQRLSGVFGAFALVAVFVACLGLFGLASFTAEQRTKEIGVRKVLGASVANIALLIAGDFVKLVGIALVLAVPLAYWIMDRWLQDFAYRTAMDAGVFILAGLLALAIALATVSYQAIRSALADPVRSLRCE